MFILNLFRRSKNAVSYEPGQVIFAEGEPGDSMYVILGGRNRNSRQGQGHRHQRAGADNWRDGAGGQIAAERDRRRQNRLQSRAGQRKAIRFMVQETPHFAITVMRSCATVCGSVPAS